MAAMKYKVFRGKTCLMSTDSLSALYDEDTLRGMAKNGYSFKMDNKAITVNALIELIAAEKKGKKK